mgnify:CR=1 FL=1
MYYNNLYHILLELERDDEGSGFNVLPHKNKFVIAYEQMLSEQIQFSRELNELFNMYITIVINNLSEVERDPLILDPLSYQGISAILKYFFNRGFRLHSIKLDRFSANHSINTIIDILNTDLDRFNLVLLDPKIQQSNEPLTYVNNCIIRIIELRDLITNQWMMEENVAGDEIPRYRETTLQQLGLPNLNIVIPDPDGGED